MRSFLLVLASVLSALSGLRAATSEIYENLGDVTGTPPQIDARAFVNYGYFEAYFSSFALPYETQNTLYYTNYNQMVGSPGFRLDHFNAVGNRHERAAVVANMPGATITATDTLMINATNVYNQGTIAGGISTYVGLQGKKVDFSRGILNIEPPSSGNLDPGSETSTNFFPGTGMSDYYWGGYTNDFQFNSTNLIIHYTNLNRFDATSPIHSVSNLFANGLTRVSLSDAMVGVYSNAVGTNFWIQVALVQVPTNLTAGIRFAPGNISTNPFRAVAFQVTSVATNTVTEEQYFNQIYFTDRLASDTNYVMLTNVLAGTYRPACYTLSYQAGTEWQVGTVGNVKYADRVIYKTNFVSPIITNSSYAAYSADIITSVSGNVGTGDFTTSAGRVEIDGDSLDLSNARIRGNSLVSVSTRHLVGTQNTLVDSPNVTYSLGSTNGTLRVRSLVRDLVPAFDGSIYAWSGLWTNYATVVVTNFDMVTQTNVVVTNTHNYYYSMTMLDASQFIVTQPVYVQDFTTAGQNTVIDDRMNVARSFKLNGEAVDIRSEITLLGGYGWKATNAPNLKYWTNHGILSISGNASMGTDRPPYDNFENYGTNTATALALRSRNLRNSGVLRADQVLRLEADLGKFQGGLSQSLGSDLIIGGRDVKLHAYTNQAAGRISINVTNSLTDSGGGAGVAFQPGGGFELQRKPKSGDLLGSTFQAVASPNSVVYNRWVAEDRGATVAGFLDNVAIGRLLLSSGARGLVIISAGEVGNYGIYVDSLTLAGTMLQAFEQGRLADALSLGDNLTLYFAVANVPAEELDGQLNGHIRWVKEFAGPNSSIAVVGPGGKVIQVNRALRESPILDSDHDGIANAYDLTPFGGPNLTVQTGSSPKAATQISWTAAPETVYSVEFTADIENPDWRPLSTVTNTAPAVQTIVVEDANGSVDAHRYYRVRLGP